MFQALKEFERGRNSRVILLIHRQESLSLLGIPISRYITIEDSEQVLRAIRLTPENVPIDLILHTPRWLGLSNRANRESADPPSSQSYCLCTPLRYEWWHHVGIGI